MIDFIYAMIGAIIGLGVLILIHELGHFLVAKRTKVGVLTFSIGFGPKILGRKVGETEYVVSAFPLGGYVKMVGEEPDEQVKEQDRERSFAHQTLGKRVAIVGAGPLFNLLLAVVIFSVIFMTVGAPALTTRVAGVEVDSAAEKARIQKGDQIIAVDGQAIRAWDELSRRIMDSKGKVLSLRLLRDGQELETAVQPTRRERENIFGEKHEVWAIGIASEVALEKSPPWLAPWQGLYRTGEYSVLTLVVLYKMVAGDVSPRNLGGPLLIAQMAGQQAQQGVASYLFFIAVLSVNLGVLNLLPIPVLDGGHLFFFLIEWVLGRPVQMRHRERAQQVGIFVLILIMIYALFNDISRFFEG